MKLLIESAMIFFGTLLAAALVALGEPGAADRGPQGTTVVPADGHLLDATLGWARDMAASAGLGR